ncbi:MAG: SEC-C metal-binding domain-containing protein, partial [Spirochaetia bacterium]|nr:SEC-C metal-binding domain-containing protein [Spirochaetia bacterium]
VSIEKSEKLSAMLTKNGIRHEVLNAKNHAREALIISEAGAKGAVTIATNMAGRGTDIKLGGNPEFRARRKAGTEAPEEKYREALLHEYDLWARDYEEVKSLGGLCVIGTERHESRRIDNQLRGRSGRQGDPGRSIFFISLDDDLMRLFGGENFKQLMSKAGMKPGEPIYHPLLNKSIESAQKKVEERNFEIRKHLLEYDDVLNKQRNFIYEQRNAILADTDLIERVRTSATEMLEDRSDLLDQSIKENQNKAIADFCSWLFDTFGIDLSPKQVADLHRSGTIIQEIQKLLDQDLSAKIESAGAESLNFFIRFSYLQEIDEKWLDHLESMEALREAVYLRSYAQKNPLLEYKLEGSDIFESLILSIRHNIASKVFRVRIQQKVEQTATIPSRAPRIEVAQTSHQSVGSFAGESEAVRQESAIAAAAAPPAATVIRQGQKIGRNDPCPCGSGKKYKHCHGR